MILNNFLKGEDFIKQNKIYQEFGKVLISKIILIDANSKEVVNIAEINNYNFNCDLPHFIKQFNHILSDSDEIDLSLPADPNLINKDLALLVFGFDDVKINNGNLIEQADLLLSSVALPKLPAKYFAESTGLNFNIIFSIENKGAKFQLFKNEATCESEVVESPAVYNIERCDCTDDPCIPDTVNIDLGSKDVDLSDYYVKSEVDSLLDNKANKKDLELKINKIDTLKFVDKEYLNKVLQDFDPLAAIKPELDSIKEQIINTPRGEVDLDDYYTKSETFNKSEINTKLKLLKDDINNINNTLEDVKVKAESKLELPEIPEIDTSSFAKKSDVYNKIEIDTKLNDVKVDPEQLKTKFYTKPEVDTKIQNINDKLDSNSANYYSKSEIDTKLSGVKVDPDQLKTKFYTKPEVDTKIKSVNDVLGSNYYSKSEIDLKLKNHRGSGGTIDAYTKLETDQKISEVTINTNKKFDDYYNKEQVESKIEGALEGSKATLSNYYKKTETYSRSEADARIKELAPKPEVDLTNYYDKDFIDIELNKKANKVDVYTKNETYNRDEIDNIVQSSYLPFLRTTNKLSTSFISYIEDDGTNFRRTYNFWGDWQVTVQSDNHLTIEHNDRYLDVTHQKLEGLKGPIFFEHYPPTIELDGGAVYWISGYYPEDCSVEIGIIWVGKDMYGDLEKHYHGVFRLNQFNIHSGIALDHQCIICGGEVIKYELTGERGSTEVKEKYRKPLIHPKIPQGCVIRKLGNNYAVISVFNNAIYKIIKYRGDLYFFEGISHLSIADVHIPQLYGNKNNNGGGLNFQKIGDKLYICSNYDYFDQNYLGSFSRNNPSETLNDHLLIINSLKLLYQKMYNVIKYLDPSVEIRNEIPLKHFESNLSKECVQTLCCAKNSKDFKFEEIDSMIQSNEEYSEDGYEIMMAEYEEDLELYTRYLFERFSRGIFTFDHEFERKFLEHIMEGNEVDYRDGKYVLTENKFLDVIRNSFTNEYIVGKDRNITTDNNFKWFTDRTTVAIMKQMNYFGVNNLINYIDSFCGVMNNSKYSLVNTHTKDLTEDNIKYLRSKIDPYPVIVYQIDLKTEEILYKQFDKSFFGGTPLRVSLVKPEHSSNVELHVDNLTHTFVVPDIANIFYYDCEKIKRKDFKITSKYAAILKYDLYDDDVKRKSNEDVYLIANHTASEPIKIKDGDEITVQHAPNFFEVTHNDRPLLMKKPMGYDDNYANPHQLIEVNKSFELKLYNETQTPKSYYDPDSLTFFSGDKVKNTELFEGAILSNTLCAEYLLSQYSDDIKFDELGANFSLDDNMFEISEPRDLKNPKDTQFPYMSDMFAGPTISYKPPKFKIDALRLNQTRFPKILVPYIHKLTQTINGWNDDISFVMDCVKRFTTGYLNYKHEDQPFMMPESVSRFNYKSKDDDFFRFIDVVYEVYSNNKLNSIWSIDEKVDDFFKSIEDNLRNSGISQNKGDEASFMPFSIVEIEQFAIELENRTNQYLGTIQGTLTSLGRGAIYLTEFLFENAAKLKQLAKILSLEYYRLITVVNNDGHRTTVHFNKEAVENNLSDFINSIKTKNKTFKLSERDKKLIINFLSLDRKKQEALLFLL